MAQGHWLDPLARQLLRSFGQLPDIRESEFYIDVNRASADDWRRLPSCNETMVDLLMRLQRGGVQFSHANDLFLLLDLPQEVALSWLPHLIFQWYSEDSPLVAPEPLDLNGADASALQQRLNWPAERLEHLLQERSRRCFDNLADLQERLSLPAAVTEMLIGKVRFSKRGTGPSLPLQGY